MFYSTLITEYGICSFVFKIVRSRALKKAVGFFSLILDYFLIINSQEQDYCVKAYESFMTQATLSSTRSGERPCTPPSSPQMPTCPKPSANGMIISPSYN